MTDRRRVALLSVSAVLLVGVLAASLLVGTTAYGPGDVLDVLRGEATTATAVISDVRWPRAVLGLVVGTALAIAGTLTQTLTRNPLADPGLLGVTAGAGFAITLAVAAGIANAQSAQILSAFVGAMLAGAVVYVIGRDAPLRLVLVGVALSAVLTGVSLGLRLLFPDVFDALRVWSVGSIAGREQVPLLVPVLVMLAGVVGGLCLARPLSAISLGDDVAHSMGVNVVRTRLAVLALVTVLTGAATAAVGPIAFLGLIVPTLARRPSGGSVPWMLMFTLVWGGLLLVAADVLGRVLLETGEVPVAVVTAFLGGFALIATVRGRPA